MTDIHYATILAQLLKDLHFPANKEKILQFILENKSTSITRSQNTDILSLVQGVQEKEYKSVADLARVIDLLQDI